ncbi:MAG: hypothetical protein IV100_30800, partial [Myxococcales bacterium]|nr:hypothetical protein [Myxococcales bacterium]
MLRAPLLIIVMVSVLSTGPARAQCVEGGAPTGESCLTTSTTYQGCCDGTATVRWCEGGKVCSKDCSTSVMNTCCQYSANPGCCDQNVMEHVCYVLGAVKCCTQSWSPSCVAIAMLEA